MRPEKVFSQTKFLGVSVTFVLLCVLLQWPTRYGQHDQEKYALKIQQCNALILGQKNTAEPINLIAVLPGEPANSGIVFQFLLPSDCYPDETQRPPSKMLRYLQHFASGLQEFPRPLFS